MSFDETFLTRLVETISKADLQVIFIGNTAAVLQGVPVMTHDVDLFVRDHPQLKRKLAKFAEILGITLTKPYGPMSHVIRTVGTSVPVDFVLVLSSGKSFESVRSRAHRIRIGSRMVWVADLQDVIAAKEAAGRPKDLATIQILKDTLRVQKLMVSKKRKGARNG